LKQAKLFKRFLRFVIFCMKIVLNGTTKNGMFNSKLLMLFLLNMPFDLR